MCQKNLKNILIYHIHNSLLKKLTQKYIRGKLIDIGCGTKPYQSLVFPYVQEHIGIDHGISPHDLSHVDLEGSAYQIPVEDGKFDSALCTSVLEHLEEPEAALRECYRVLKSQGIAIYSIPFIWHIHESPRDFFRFSKYGIEYLLKKAGFEILEIIPIMGFWGTFGQMFVYNLYRFNRGPLRWFRIIDLVGLVVQGISYVLDRIDRAEAWACMYMIVAKKP